MALLDSGTKKRSEPTPALYGRENGRARHNPSGQIEHQNIIGLDRTRDPAQLAAERRNRRKIVILCWIAASLTLATIGLYAGEPMMAPPR